MLEAESLKLKPQSSKIKEEDFFILPPWPWPQKIAMKFHYVFFSYYLRSPGRKQGHDEKSWVPELGPSQKTHTTPLQPRPKTRS